MSSLAGQTFAGYEIICELGRGGMGAVYKARQPRLDRLVALKVMSSDLASDPDFVARFKREANAAASLNHENIVQVFSAGEFEGGHFIAMEFVEGTTLRHHIQNQGRLDPREAVAITILVAQALQYAWNKARLIHRDIKPENIFLSNVGEVKVGDLGLAKTVGGGTTSLTQTGMMMGSPHYISPEQARGLSDIDFRTDVYSLGCTLYHMLTGRPPYEGSDPLVVINKHVNEPPPAIFKVWPTCPIPLALAAGKMLAKNRNDRPASYEDLIEQLREVHGKLKPATAVAPVSASEPTQVLPAPAPKPVVARTSTPRPTPAAKRKSVISDWRFVIGGAAAVALIAGAVWWFAGRGGEGAGGTKVLDLGGGVKMELVAIPPGEFLFGNNPSHKAAIRDEFWLGRTEVTVGQWKQFVAATGYETRAEKSNGAAHWCPQGPGKGTVGAGSKGTYWRTLNVGFPLQDNHPVACITWNDAMAFCEWLTERERKAGRLRADYVLRLPTEAEWEYACRAGTTTKFWWGDDVNDGEGRVNWGGTEDGFEFMSPVDHFGERGRNRLGLADMLGNVAELCLDCFDAAGTDGQPSGGTPRCAPRGGSFSPGRGDCSTRNPHARSELPYGTEGFRVCLGPDALGSAASAAAVPAAPATARQLRQTLDLLALTDPVKDRVQAVGGTIPSKANVWERRDGALVYVSDGSSGKLVPPVAIHARSYEIEILYERLSGSGGFLVDLPIEGSQLVSIYVDVPGFRTINSRIGRPWPSNTAKRGCVVVRMDRGESGSNDRITVHLDGELWEDWKGDLHALESRKGEPHPDFAGQLMFSLFARKDNYKFTTWTLRVFDGEATVLRGGDTAPTADVGWQNAINLLPLIDPAKDAVEGTWTIENGELIGDNNGFARIEIPYQPPSEYDFLVEFKQLRKGIGGCQHLAKAGRNFTWNFFGASGSELFAFEKVGGQGMQGNPTTARLSRIELGRVYASMVQVRNGQVTAFLDGKQVSSWKTNYTDMDAYAGWKLRNPSLLGVGSQSRLAFRRIEIREVTGKGTFTRGAPAAQSNTPTLQHSNPPAALSAFCAEVAALPAEQQVARVVAKLKELNPRFGGKATHKIVDGQVEELHFGTAVLSDISPIRALAQLKKLTCSGFPDRICPLSDISPLRDLHLDGFRLVNTRVSDFSPLAGMPLKQFYCDPAVAAQPANRAILRSIRTLEKINNLPTAEFWKKVEAGDLPKP
ncbi:MAG: SUMF1/EgtB/PvdO family nonheme iron enzyme [Verrucomicrobia bacterium]|nr:SUMF1/EgtB/PvdO family nonheme iron enzyme [Verrucomicrobiota bacterium]